MSHEGLFTKKFTHEVRKRAEAVEEETGTETRYAQLTWSNKQILCDSLQNNLDAESRKFIAGLEYRFVANAGACTERAKADSEWKTKYLALLNLLYTLSYRASDLQTTEKETLISEIHDQADGLGVYLKGVTSEQFTSSERPNLPEIVYAVKEVTTGKIIRNLKREDISVPPFDDTSKYPLFEFRVQDSGSGYDVTKSILYLPTKENEQFSRGMFGEGLKVNQAAVARVPGVTLRIHSSYETESGTNPAWVRHAYAEDDMVMQKGINFSDLPGVSSGSGTTIRFTEYLPANESLLGVLDPRQTPIESIAADYGNHLHKFPLGIGDDGIVQPGISLVETKQQYLQGLRIGDGAEPLLFSYDFHDRDIIAGRDRKHLDYDVLTDTIEHFWNNVTDPTLLAALAERVLYRELPDDCLEREVLFQALKRVAGDEATPPDTLLVQALIDALKLRTDMPNYIATDGDVRVSHIDPSSVNVCSIQLSCSDSERASLLAAIHKAAPNITFLKVEARENESQLSDPEQALAIEIQQLFDGIHQELHEMWMASPYLHSVPSTIDFRRHPYRHEISFEVVRDNDSEKIICFLPYVDTYTSEVLDNNEAKSGLQMKLRTLYVAALGTSKGKIDSSEREYNEIAQRTAQFMLDDSSWRYFNPTQLADTYRETKTAAEKQLIRMTSFELQRDIDEKLCQMSHEVASRSVTMQRLLEISQFTSELDWGKFSQAKLIFSRVSGRIIVRSGIISYFEESTDKAKASLELKEIALSSLQPHSTWAEYPVYHIGSRFIIVVPTETRSSLVIQREDGNMEIGAVCDDMIVHINKEENEVKAMAEAYPYYALDEGCIISYNEPSETNNHSVQYHPATLSRSIDDGVCEAGIVKSPVTLEYISEHWSEPERIFADLVQNHLDAGGFEQRFLIIKNDERIWVTGPELTKDDVIVGYELSDQGPGYSPSGIHHMGHTRKRNPFLAGKNGEGLKLAAASAKKQGFDITFKSFGIDKQGATTGWEANAAVLEQPYVHDGITHNAHRLAFDISLISLDELDSRSAVTVLTLPNNADTQTKRGWTSWINCVDPRRKDHFGTSGIDRIVITSENGRGASDTVGPTTVLLERPGAIFENSILIRSTTQTTRKYTLGWDFPSITSTRERTHIDEGMAGAYISNYFTHTQDERVVKHFLQQIQIHELRPTDLHWYDDNFQRILKVANARLQKLDTDPSWVLPIYASTYPSKPLFKKIARELYPDMVLFSYEYAALHRVPMDGSLRHIPESNRLNVSHKDYETLRHIFPTMQTYMEDINNSRLDLSPDELTPLRNIIGEEVKKIAPFLDWVASDQRYSTMLSQILKAGNVTLEEVKIRLNSLLPEVIAGTDRDVFIMAEETKADGLASAGIGLRLSLIDPNRMSVERLFGVIYHELAHKMLDARDYTDEFIQLLLLLSRLQKTDLSQH